MIFVEGHDDKKFIKKLLEHLKKDQKITIKGKDRINFNNYLQKMKGKTKLLKYDEYKNITKTIENKKITKCLFIFDCDFEKDDNQRNGMEKSQACFDQLKKELNWSISSDSYIFNRNLDYFLLTTLDEKDCYEHFKELVNCLKIKETRKNRKPIANLYRDLYPHPQFDFSHKNFDELKRKLVALFE